jgi:hypothetical protein
MLILSEGLYRHYKGNLYVVTDVVRHTESKDYLVVYHEKSNPESSWARPLDMFKESVSLPTGEVVPRFERIQLT